MSYTHSNAVQYIEYSVKAEHTSVNKVLMNCCAASEQQTDEVIVSLENIVEHLAAQEPDISPCTYSELIIVL